MTTCSSRSRPMSPNLAVKSAFARSWNPKIVCVVTLGLVFLCGAAAGAVVMNLGVHSRLHQPACSPDTPYPAVTYNLGERVDLGHLVYLVFDTQWLTHIGEGPDAKIPQNRFFLVRISATNGLSSEIMVPGLTVEDDNGKSYAELSTDVGAPQWMGILRRVKPAEST